MSEIARRAMHASLWSGADGVIRALIGFAITIVLTRLVSPAEFGIVAMILVFSAVAGIIVESGLGTALIQRQDITRVDESTVFYFNLGVGFAMGVALSLAGPWIADFFNEPVLTGISRLMAVNLMASAFGTIHTTLLMKELNFRPLLFIGLWSMSLSGAVAIWLAWHGYGVWSLAWQMLLQTVISTILLWAWHPWRPLRQFSVDSLQRLLAFSSSVMATKLIDTIYTRLYSLFIGKLFSASALGFYSRAQSTQQLPSSLLASVLNRVALPAFSQTAHDPKKLSAALAKATRLLMFVNLPALTGLALMAGPAVKVLFGDRWMPAAHLLQILCIVGALWPLQVLNLSALIAQGHSGLLLKIELIKKAIGTVALLVAIPFGLEAIAWSQAAASGIAFLINSHYSGRFLALGAGTQLYTLRKPILASFLMAICVFLANLAFDLNPLPKLIIISSIGASVYLGACLLLRDRSFGELLTALRGPMVRAAPPQREPGQS